MKKALEYLNDERETLARHHLGTLLSNWVTAHHANPDDETLKRLTCEAWAFAVRHTAKAKAALEEQRRERVVDGEFARLRARAGR